MRFHFLAMAECLCTMDCCYSAFLSPPFRPTNRRETESKISVVESSEARQKFAGAKAISSDMFFGREADAEASAG